MNLFELFVKIGVDDQASGSLSKITSGLGKGLATAAKIGTAAVGAAAAGISALTKQSVQSYAEFEQLVGGAELMFGGAFQAVMQNAQDAYKTVQMSQNEYLQQVNGFATGLKTALGGNEQQAADLAHRIIQAEADIIAATGNTAENVQNAFNGIMKSNFTMLDNLQIGITPTKEGFQEVIDKVNEWNKANGEATSYQMDNLADMQSALVDYIEMVGMSGYAQAEASKTISGSIASMRSAWSNLLTGLADDNADFGKLVDNLVYTLAGDENGGGVINNMLPRIEKSIGGIAALIEKAAPVIVNALPALVDRVVPSLISAATGMVNSAIAVLPSLLQTVVDAIIQNAPALTVAAVALVKQILTSVLNMLPDVLQLGVDLVFVLLDGIIGMVNDPHFVQTIVDVVLKMVDVLTDPNTITNLLNAAVTLMVALSRGLIQALPQLLAKVPEIIRNLAKAFMDFYQPVVDIGKNIVEGIKSGISRAWNNLVSWFKGLFGDLINIAKRILGIASPSKEFAKIGSFAADGFGVGFDDAFSKVKKDIGDAFSFDDARISVSSSVRNAKTASSAVGTSNTDALLIELIGMLRAGIWFDGGDVLGKVVGYANRSMGTMKQNSTIYAMG